MRLKRNRAERLRELLDGIGKAPAAFKSMAEAAQRMTADMRHLSEFGRIFSHLRNRERPPADTGTLK